MYNAIKFFGSCKELLSFTRSLRATELLEQAYNNNVHANHAEYHSSIPEFSEEHGCE